MKPDNDDSPENILRRPANLYGEIRNRRNNELNHSPKREPLRFDLNLVGAPNDVEQLVNNIKRVAESFLYHWKTFPIVLPSPVSITCEQVAKAESPSDRNSDGYQSRRLRFYNLRDFFVAPSFDELDTVALDSSTGEPKKLNAKQLDCCRERGEFEVKSANFPGQVHRWRLSGLLQKGCERTKETLLNDLALALRFILITASNRFVSHFFSLTAAFDALINGLWLLLDILIGLPSLHAHNLDSKIREERSRYLVAELISLADDTDNIYVFCDWLRKEVKRAATEKVTVLQNAGMLSGHVTPCQVPYRYETPQGNYIDLRLWDRDIMKKCLPILATILEQEARGWFLHFRERMIAELRAKNLTDEQIQLEVNDAVMKEYLNRIFNSILNHADLKSLGDGIPQLLVEHAQSIVLMNKAVTQVTLDLQQSLDEARRRWCETYPLISRIEPWLRSRLAYEQLTFALENEWTVHERVIEMCKSHGLQQTVYFLNRDLTFMREREAALVRELRKVKHPTRTYQWARQIWLPQNWVVKQFFQGETQIIPTVLSQQPTSITTPRSDPSQPIFLVEREVVSVTTSRWPFWRWLNYIQRTCSWTWNAMFLLAIVIPWCSPFGIRALFSTQPFMPDLELSQINGMLFPRKSSTTATLCSRLIALWRHISKSRTHFETKPDTGLIGKGATRYFNRLWNYLVKGFFGTVLLLVGMPVVCILCTVLCVLTAATTVIWMPIATLLLHLFMVLIYDIDCPSANRNPYFVLLEAVVWNVFVQGLVQPVFALIIAIVICPVVAIFISTFALVHYWIRLLWDTTIFHLIIKKRARIPASNSFMVKRIAGPGLVSDYYLQIRPEQALAAFEAKLELEQLQIYQRYTENLILQPQKDFQQFVEACFGAFSAQLAKVGVYKHLEKECQDLVACLHEKLERRRRDLQTGLSTMVRSKIKLAPNDLKMTIEQSAIVLQQFYPTHIISHLHQSEDEFWESRGLQTNDWASLASLLYTDIFGLDFLEPLDINTQTSFKLEPEPDVNVGKYTELLVQRRIQAHLDRDGNCVNNPPDLLNAVYYTPRGNVQVPFPYVDISVFNPRTKCAAKVNSSVTSRDERLTDTITICSLRSIKRRHKSDVNRLKKKLAQAAANCDTENSLTPSGSVQHMWTPWKRHRQPFRPDKLMIPLNVPHPVRIAVIVHNRDSEQPIPIDSDVCQAILASCEEAQFLSNQTVINRYRGGYAYENYESTVDSSDSSISDKANATQEYTPAVSQVNVHSINAIVDSTSVTQPPPRASTSYHWTLTQWRTTPVSSRKPVTARVELASPEDVTLDTDQFILSTYGTTV